jgi:hypothetical protein
LVDLIKGLREDGIRVNIADGESQIIEKSDSDLALNLGIICATAAGPILQKVLARLYQKYSKEDKKVSLTWYHDKKKNFFLMMEPSEIWLKF